MPSRADAVRAGIEWSLRGGAILLLGASLVTSILALHRGPAESAATPTLAQRLARWSTVASPSRVDVRLDHPPGGRDRDWLAALSGAATRVAWSGPQLAPTAIAAEPRADPQGGVEVSVAAPAGAPVVLADTLGVLDSSRASAAGVRAYVPKSRATVDAVVGPVDARGAVRDSLELKSLFVVGAAGWEAKFAVAALEERGWKVDAYLAVSPKGDVLQRGGVRGTLGAERRRMADLDTARYSAVLAIDSTAERFAQRIADFVREGGGLVLWTPAARVTALAAVAPGRPGGIIREKDGPPPDSAPRSALELMPIVSLVPDAVVLEQRGDAVAVAARRVGVGRVIETGYTDSWRWRMAGGVDAPMRQRAWLAGLVSLVAYAPRHAIAAAPSDAAPLASLIDRLGPPAAAVGQGIPMALLVRWVFALLCGALFVEWASRRLRGAK